jgi:hypothetical protein
MPGKITTKELLTPCFDFNYTMLFVLIRLQLFFAVSTL